ncbi:MAG: lipid-A-disaccharide synthase [Steroidobacteraceae bacterium]|jgi:lipid-A-disaccharide synthase
MSSLRVAIVAGETSGDALGAALIEALRALAPQAEFMGVAGPRMRAAGCRALLDAQELAVIGLVEVLPHLPRLLRLRARLVREITALKPDVFIGVDYQQFNLGLALRLKQRGFTTVQYVSPQVWAWRQGRVNAMARAFDLVLCLLPFEPAFYRAHALPAQFVGHPLADQIPLLPDRAAARASLGLAAGSPVLALLPGSRANEIQRLAKDFIGAAVLLARRRPELQIIAPMAGPIVRAQFERSLQECAVGLKVPALPGSARADRPLLQVLDGQARTALCAADVALVASGTATLEALLCRCPMVVAYRVGAITGLLLRRLVRLPYFSLPNLLAAELLVPEFSQQGVQPESLARELERVLEDAPQRDYLQRRFQAIHESLRQNGAALAAAAVLQLLRERATGHGAAAPQLDVPQQSKGGRGVGH